MCVCVCVCLFMCVCRDGRCFSPQLARPVTGSVQQMKAINKWGLYLVGAEYVTVSSGFILNSIHSPKRQFGPGTCDRL